MAGVGACVFAVSDFVLAYDKFVHKFYYARCVVMSLYVSSSDNFSTWDSFYWLGARQTLQGQNETDIK